MSQKSEKPEPISTVLNKNVEIVISLETRFILVSSRRIDSNACNAFIVYFMSDALTKLMEPNAMHRIQINTLL